MRFEMARLEWNLLFPGDFPAGPWPGARPAEPARHHHRGAALARAGSEGEARRRRSRAVREPPLREEHPADAPARVSPG